MRHDTVPLLQRLARRRVAWRTMSPAARRFTVIQYGMLQGGMPVLFPVSLTAVSLLHTVFPITEMLAGVRPWEPTLLLLRVSLWAAAAVWTVGAVWVRTRHVLERSPLLESEAAAVAAEAALLSGRKLERELPAAAVALPRARPRL